MQYTTGLPTDEFADLLIRLREEGIEGCPLSLGLRDSLKAVLIRMRHNVIQAVIGEQMGVSQPTISRAIKALTAAIARTLVVLLLTARCPRTATVVVDGTLFPCWNRRNRRDLWSGKRRRAGMNVQILVQPDGRFVWASDPYPGSMHDVAALDASGLLEGRDPSGWIGDKGYVGRGIITPHKKPPTENSTRRRRRRTRASTGPAR